MLKKLVVTFIALSSATAAQAQLANNMANNIKVNAKNVLHQTAETTKKAAENFTFNYYVKYLGPSLSPDMQEGSTFNRFQTGQDANGQELDFKASHQTYQAFKLGYKLPKGMIISYGVTYQDDVKKGIDYESGGSTYTREYGRSFNNHRVGLWIPAIYKNDIFFTGSTIYYERPTTEGSKEMNMLYGAGIQPTVGFYSSTPGLYYGIDFSFERDVYPDNEFSRFPNWCQQPGYTCKGVDPIVYKRQTFRASVSPYLNYALTDKTTLKSKLAFDWDQDGDQADTFEFSNNMEDIAEFGVSYMFSSNIVGSAGVEASLVKASLQKTALFGSLSLRI